MGTDDSGHSSKRSIAHMSRALLGSNTQSQMRTNLVTKFLLLVAIISLLIYVLADHVPSGERAASRHPIRPSESRPISVASAPAPAPAPPPMSLKKDAKEEETEPISEEEINEKALMKAERNIEKTCNHTVVGWGKRTVMHDILNYISILEKPITYLDVGANVGITSLPVLFCFKEQHRVVAVEPVRVNYEGIIRAVTSMSVRPLPEERFLVANVGFSDTTKKTKMYIPGRRGDNAALAEKASTTVFKGGLREEEVQVYRGGDFLKMHKVEPKLVKIDVQGSEILVLKGLEDYLKSVKGVLVMAEHDDRLIKNSGFGLFDVFDYMKGLGFKIYHKPEVSVKNDEFWVDSDEVERDALTKIRGDLVFWNGGE